MRAWIIGLVSAVLAACGGGGGGSAPPPAPSVATTNPHAAWMSLLSNTRTYSAAGTGSDGRQYAVSLTIAPSTGMTVGGTAFPSTTFTTQLTRNGAFLSSTFAEYAYETATGRVMFISYAGGGCAALSASHQLPATASLGAAGPMFAGQYSPSCITPNAQTLTATWSFEADGANAMLCINQRRALLVTHTESWCVAVNAAGVPLSAARVSISDGAGFSLTAR